jgi:uncharacterized membrane protein
MDANLWLAAVSIGSSLLLIALALPLIRKQIPPNALYGLRVPATFADESVWYEANARSGRDFLYLGLMLLVMAIAIAVARLGAAAYLAWAVLTLIGVMAMAITGWLRANRLLKERQRVS